MKNIFGTVKNWFTDLPKQNTFDDSLERLQNLSKYKRFLENKVEVQNRIIEYQQQENNIQAELLDAYRPYAPKNLQYREGKKYKGDLINLNKKGNFYEYK